MLRLKRAKIQLRKDANIDRHLYGEGGGAGGESKFVPGPTLQASVKCRDIEELYLR